MRHIAIIIITLMMAPVGANGKDAPTITGNQLLEACSKRDSPDTYAFCNGYIIGVVEGLNYGALGVLVSWKLAKDTSSVNKLVNFTFGFCGAEGASYKQYIDIIAAYLKNHPKARNLPARGLIHLALKDAFPCKK